MRTLYETEKLVLAQQDNGTAALGQLIMLAQLVPEYAERRFFDVTEQLLAHVQTNTYVILYERAAKDGPLLVPVAFYTWGKLSRARAALWREGLINLSVADLNGGAQLWLVMGSKQLGHEKELKDHFLRAMKAESLVHARGNSAGSAIAEKNPYYEGG